MYPGDCAMSLSHDEPTALRGFSYSLNFGFSGNDSSALRAAGRFRNPRVISSARLGGTPRLVASPTLRAFRRVRKPAYVKRARARTVVQWIVGEGL